MKGGAWSDAYREAILRDISDDIAQIMADTLSGTDCDALARKIIEGAIRHVAVPALD